MTLAVAGALNLNKPNQMSGGSLAERYGKF